MTVMKRLPKTEQGIELVISDIEQLINPLDCNELVQFQVITCCREAMNNIVEHARGSCFYFRARIFRLSPDATPILGVVFQQPDSELARTTSTKMPLFSMSGRGWLIMEKWLDQVRIEQGSGVSRVRLTKRLNTSPLDASGTATETPSYLTGEIHHD